ncbi:MAG: thermonuclease family protein [Sideroxyarcus sp.]|nr:thermonuclease family protein [Sideroxyarcus sp.]
MTTFPNTPTSNSIPSLSDLVFNKDVIVESSKKDRYGRTVGKILVDGVDANLEQFKAGLAWHYKQYQREQSVNDRTFYAQAEEQARAENRGLWVDTGPTPPWDWRKQKKAKHWQQKAGSSPASLHSNLN